MASLISLLDFTKICRLCLSNDHTLHDIFMAGDNLEMLPSLASKILGCVSIEVEPGDNLPDKICNRCIEQLENWVKFKELCDNANTLLLQCAAGIPPLSDEILQKNLQRNNSDSLDIPETSSDFCLEDVSLLEHDSLFQKLDESRHEDLSNTESLVNNSFSRILNENFQKATINESKLNNLEEEESIKEATRHKWREKYSKIYRKNYNCGLCPKVFTKFTNLLQHDKVDHKDIAPEEVCIKCGRLFISKLRLDIHDYMKHKEKIYECEVCGFKSVSEKSLKVHKQRHSEQFVCNVCGAAASTQRNLQHHFRVHSEDKPFNCDICERTFKHHQSLQQHLKTHATDFQPEFKCNICSHEFKTLQYLKIHKNSHNVESSAVCDICGALLKNKTTLYVHKLAHKTKQNICMVCDKSFSTKNLLNRHILVHGAHPFVCTICNKSYNRADTLSMHIKTHDKSQVYCCHQCDHTFTLNKYLKRHIERMHNKEGNR